MGSVQTSCVCARCGYAEAFTEFYWRTGNEITFCERCGYFLESRGGLNEVGGGYGVYQARYQGLVTRVASFKRRQCPRRRHALLARMGRNLRCSYLAFTHKNTRGRWQTTVLKDIQRWRPKHLLRQAAVGELGFEGWPF